MSKIYQKLNLQNNFLRIILLSAFCVLQLNNLKAQWLQLDLLSGGSSNTVEKVGNELWAGSWLGIYKSADEGNTWSLYSDFTNLNIRKIEAYGDTVLVLYSRFNDHYKVFSKTSFDSGLTWSEETLVTVEDNINQVFELLRRDNKLYIFGDWNSFVSNNFGLTWEVYIDWTSNISGIKFFDYSGYIYTTYNDLTYFKNFQTNTTTAFISPGAGLLENGSVKIDNYFFFIYSEDGSSNYNLIKTNDFGNTWETIYTFDEFSSYFFSNFIELNGDVYLVDFFNSGLKISDNGNTIEEFTAPDLIFAIENNSFLGFERIDYVQLTNGDFLLSGGSQSGLPFKLYDPSLNFLSDKGEGFKTRTIDSFEKKENVVFLNSGYNTYMSYDNLISWDTILNTGFIYGKLVLNDTIAFIGINNSNSDYSLYYSFNNGQTWNINPLGDLIENSNNLNVSSYTLAEVNGTLYLEGGYKIFFSNNWGQTWQPCPDWPTNFNGFSYNGIQTGHLQKVNNQLLLGTLNESLILKLNPINQTWEYFYGEIQSPFSYIEHKIIKTDNILFSFSTNHFMYTTNNGQTWNHPDMEGVPIRDLFDTIYPSYVLEKQNVLYGAFQEYGIFYSLDNGNHWNAIQNPSPFSYKGGMFFNNDLLYSGSLNGGIWRRSGLANIVTGNVFIDQNMNGIRDLSENGASNILVKSSLNNTMVSTDSNGDYLVYSELQGDTIKAISPFSFAQTSPDFYISDSTTNNLDFALQLQPFNDLSIGVTALNVFRPGFDTYLNLSAQNLGSESSPAIIKFLLPNDVIVLFSEPNFSSQSGDTLIWNVPSITFLENYDIQLHVNSSVFAPLGDSANCYAEVFPVINDSIPNNNTFTLKDIFVGSYDPNDKNCVQGDNISIIELINGIELQYVIRFQNTGTYEAENIRIEDQLSPLLQTSTFRIIDQSHHPMNFEINESGLLKFYFNGIQLPDSFNNEPESHGFVKYAIKPKQNIPIGETINNTAEIYFDFNEPIITNTTVTEVIDTEVYIEKISGSNYVNNFSVLPNPVHNTFVISNLTEMKDVEKCVIFDVCGKEIYNSIIDNLSPIIDARLFASGMYHGILYSKSKSLMGKFKFIKN